MGDNPHFTIKFDGDTIYINDFPVTRKDWEQVIRGETVELTKKKPDDTATLTKKKDEIYFNGKPITGPETTNIVTITEDPENPQKPNGRDPDNNNPNGPNNPNEPDDGTNSNGPNDPSSNILTF